MPDEHFTVNAVSLAIAADRGQLAARRDGECLCTVACTVRETDVLLRVGPCMWQWNRATGELIGHGTGDAPNTVSDLPYVAPVAKESEV